ncbi:MAG: phosphinothricin acetyltransferase [Candidatus Azotimanducaceae bacterium]
MTLLNIRQSSIEDLEALRDIYNYYVLNTPITFDIEPVDLSDREVWLRQFNHNDRHFLYTATNNGKVVGYASSSQFRTKAAYNGSVETTIYLHPERIGGGAGKALYSHLLEQLRNSGTVHRCYGVITLPNEASVGLHRSLGYHDAGKLTQVGFKFGQYWDTLWMELPL